MIEIRNLSFRYGQKEVLSNLSLTLEPGRIYGLLGENGVGKTTLLSLLCGLKRPARGTIVVPVGGSPWKRKPSFLEWVYFLPDELPAYAGSPLQFEREFAPFRRNFDHEGFHRLLQLFEIDTQQRMDQMSYGQLKKVHIAFTLHSGAGLILMDEPTNGLDIPSKMQFRQAVKSRQNEGSAIVISTHQVRDVAELLDHLVLMDICRVLLSDSIGHLQEKMYQEGNPFGLSGDFDIEQVFNAVRTHPEYIL